MQALPADAQVCVGLSGGGDSTALVHALAQLALRPVRALHVDHGLQESSEAWASHCLALCASIGVPCTVARVQVDRTGGEGIEAAARRARYEAFVRHLADGEYLMLAHHRDDQAETVLLKLLRGAGPEGLAGMRPIRPLGRGQLMRPLLDVPRAALQAYVADRQLPVIADPSNHDPAIARVWLRTEIVPRLQRHWPQTVDSLTHSARASAAAANYLATVWRAQLVTLRRGDALDARGWLALHEALRVPLLEAWLHGHGLAAPSTAQRAQIEKQIIEAAPDRVPCIRYGTTEVYLWRGAIHAQRQPAPIDDTWSAGWRGERLMLPGAGSLQASTSLARPLTVRLRRGKERIKPAGDAHTRDLRDLFQAGALPPWQRQRCPLLFDGRELVAVGDRWVSATGAALLAETGATLRWNPSND
jgi:tRNA(Ile)-lysidine synthase